MPCSSASAFVFSVQFYWGFCTVSESLFCPQIDGFARYQVATLGGRTTLRHVLRGLLDLDK